MGRHFYHRKDGNHDAAVRDLRAAHLSVTSTSAAGDGFPDLIVGVPGLTIVGQPTALATLRAALLEGAHPGLIIHDGANLIVELKDGAQGDRRTPPATRQRQESWWRTWRGQKAKCLSVASVFALTGRNYNPEG